MLFYRLIGNVGVSIILLTFVLRILVFAISYKSEGMMQKMKTIQPKIQRLKELYSDDQERLRREMMNLYKVEKVNPVGCLPMLAQIPIFFAVYKVLDVAIEMRHASFLWISDLSAKDPSNVFTLFGLFSWQLPEFLHLGICPILMAFSTFLQQKFAPQPDDPMHAKIFKYLPLIFLIPSRLFPVGLLIYWTFSNIFGILQQVLLGMIRKRKESAQQKS